MKTHTTNYRNTFIEVAEDCTVSSGKVPPTKGDKPSVARLQYDMLIGHPYRFTSDDVLFSVFATRKEISQNEREGQMQEFFSKGQPCFRASPLPKSYGWGVHHNEEGKIALYGMEAEEYQSFIADESVKKFKAMRSRRK